MTAPPRLSWNGLADFSNRPGRAAQVLLRPTKVRHECPACGLSLHDTDAIRCKHCGTTPHIRTEGGVQGSS